MEGEIERFISYVIATRAEATAKAYSAALARLLGYAANEGITDIAGVNPTEFTAYLKTEGLAGTTIENYLAALSQFALWCHEEGILKNGKYLLFAKRMRRTRNPAERKLPRVPEEDTFQRVIAQAHKDHGGTYRQNLGRLRDIALIETLRSTGCRAAEVTRMRRQDLRDQTAVITGKGSKMRQVFFDDRAWAAVMTYLDLRGDDDPRNPVFARHDRRAKGVMAMSTNSVRDTVDRLAREAGVDPAEISPHKFRHRFGTRVLQDSGNLAATQDLLGHSNPATTRIYARMTPGVLAQVHSNVSL